MYFPKMGKPNSTRALPLKHSFEIYPTNWVHPSNRMTLSGCHSPTFHPARTEAFWLSNYYHTVKHLQTSSFTLSLYTYLLKQYP